MKKLNLVLISLLLINAGVQNASAHAKLDSSFPMRNQIIKVLPPLIWLEFDGDLIDLAGKQVNKLTVTNSKKIRVDIGGPIVGGARISTKLKPGLSTGKYLVTYRVVSEDGHPVEGSFSFTYNPR